MENNLTNVNQDQPAILPTQETPAQIQEISTKEAPTHVQDISTKETAPVETKEKTKGKKMISVFLILLILIFIATAAYVFIIKPKSEKAETVITDKNIPSTNSVVTQSDNVSTESPFGKLTNGDSENNLDCNNMECLIEAVKKCEPMTVTISYTNESNQLLLSMKIFNEMVFSGKTIYEVKNTNEENMCSISISTPVAVAKFSDESKKELIDLGSTEEDIADLLKTINDSLSLIEVAQSKKICSGKSDELAELLSDSQKGSLNLEVTNGEILYKTTSGKPIKCYIQEPPKQRANSGVQVTVEECEAKSGNVRFTEDSGEACYIGEKDLGKILYKNGTVTPSTQCCVSNQSN